MNPYPMGVAPPPPSGGMAPNYPGAPSQGYPGYPQPAYPGYPGQSGYPQTGYPTQPGYPQPGYPAQSGYPSQAGFPPQPGFTQAGYPSQSGYPPQPGFQPQPGYPQPGYPSPGAGSYPSQPYPSGGVPPVGFNQYPGYPGYTQQAGPPGQPLNYPSTLSQTQAVQQNSSDQPHDYASSIEYLHKMSKEEITDEGRQAFYNLAGQDGEIDAFELQDILNKVFQRDFKFDGFTVDLTRSMVAMRDYDFSGKLNFEDFKKLWSDLATCKKAFVALDTDNSGHFNRSEFHKGLSSIGINISDNVMRALMMRYTDKDGNIRFNDFVASYIKLKTMTMTFRAKDVYNQGVADFNKDEYVQLCMYS